MIRSLKLGKFGIDVMFNYGSLVLLASSGVIINFVLIHFYGTAILGKFNLIYAFYIIISQFSALGVHYSVLRSLALTENQSINSIRKIITSAIILVFLIGSFVAIFIKMLAPIFYYFYKDTFIVDGISNLAYALPLFAINKVILGAFNGLRHMRLFALGQSCRYLSMVFYIALISVLGFDSSYLISVFYFAEQCLFLILLTIIFFVTLKKKIGFSKSWFIHHLKFGTDAFLTGVFLEINSRIDLVILAIFVNSSLVGVYSFAAMIAEGFAMMLFVLRNNVNPIIAKLLHEEEYHELFRFMAQIRKYSYLGMTTIIALTFVIYLYLINYLLSDAGLHDSWIVLLIISSCQILFLGYLPFSDFLIQANKPRLQSLQNILVVISNILLCFLLIPTLGIIGAAMAAGISSYIISILLIECFARDQDFGFLNLHKLDLKY